VAMDAMPRELIEARLRLDEELDALLSAGDYKTVLQMVELVRGDLTVFARAARRLAADHGEPVAPRKPLDEATQEALSQCVAAIDSVREREARQATAGENVAFLSDQVERRRRKASGWA
jgi:hypothetical protein